MLWAPLLPVTSQAPIASNSFTSILKWTYLPEYGSIWERSQIWDGWWVFLSTFSRAVADCWLGCKQTERYLFVCSLLTLKWCFESVQTITFLERLKKKSFFWQKKAIQNRKLTSTTTPQPYPLLMEQDLEVRRLDVISAVKYDLYKETAFCDVLFNSFKCHLPWFIALMSLKWISFFFLQPSAKIS